MNLLSHSQEVGEKRTYTGVIPSTIKQGQFTKFRKTDGSMVMINDKNVLCIEIFKEEKDENNNTDR